MKQTLVRWLIGLLFVIPATLISSQTSSLWSVTVTVDNPTPYVGEQITYTVQIRYPDSSNPAIITEPLFEGFGRTSYIDEPNLTRETINQMPSIISTQTIPLTPLRAGTFTLEPYRLTTGSTPFNESETIQSESLTITVSPLPLDAPETFINAVGQFTISTQIEQSTLTVGDAIQLTMIISGTGNLEQIIPPAPEIPETWQVSPSSLPVIYENARYGTKRFIWTIVPADTTLNAIPPFIFSYFNPLIDAYETRQTPPIPVNLVAVPTTAAVIAAQQNTDREPVPLLMLPSQAQVPLPAWIWISLIIGAPLFTAITWLVRRVIPASRQQQTVLKPSSVKTIIARLDKLPTNDPQKGFEELVRILISYVELRTTRHWTVEEFREQGRDITPVLWQKLIPILEESIHARYAPITPSDLTVQVKRMRQIVQSLEKQ